MEAAYAGKPVIVMGPSAYDELGCATFVGSAEQLARALDSASPGFWAGAVSYGLMMRRRGFSLDKVRRSEGTYLIDGQRMPEPTMAAKHLSHALHRITRWHRERG